MYGLLRILHRALLIINKEFEIEDRTVIRLESDPDYFGDLNFALNMKNFLNLDELEVIYLFGKKNKDKINFIFIKLVQFVFVQ